MKKPLNYTGGSIIFTIILITLLFMAQVVMIIAICKQDLKNIDKPLKRKLIWFFTFFMEMSLLMGGLIGYYLGIWSFL